MARLRAAASIAASGRSGGAARFLRLRGEGGERLRLACSELGEHLPIERHAGRLEAGDERAVGEPVLTRGGVDADDPQTTEVALLAAAADERVLERGIDGFLRRTIQLALGLEEAFRPREKLLALGAADGSTFDSRHRCSLSGSEAERLRGSKSVLAVSL